MIRLTQDKFHAGPTVCLLQSNLDQRLRDNTAAPEADGHSAQTVAEHFGKLCVRASQNHVPKPDLLIWPETSFPSQWYQVSRKLPLEKVPHEWRDAEIDIRDRLKALVATYTHIPHLIGINGNNLDEHGKFRRFNTALFVDANGLVNDEAPLRQH